jgi:D-aminopeptidase
VVDASEEAVLNSLFMAETVTGRSGHVRYALPVDAVREVLAHSRARGQPMPVEAIFGVMAR